MKYEVSLDFDYGRDQYHEMNDPIDIEYEVQSLMKNDPDLRRVHISDANGREWNWRKQDGTEDGPLVEWLAAK